MCGIVGIWDSRGKRAIDRDVLLRMNESQHHRGPDETGAHIAPGHRRSATSGCRSSTWPPASSRCSTRIGSVVVVFNGEIYNYRELIPELTALGHVFRTRSDTEVIVHAWEAWGEACVERFRGMFAFALWDEKRADAVPGARPARRQAAVLRAAARRHAAVRLGAQVAAGARRTAARHRSARGRRLLRARLRAGAAHDLRARRASCRPATRCACGAARRPAAPRRYWDVRFTGDNPISAEDAQAELVERLQRERAPAHDLRGAARRLPLRRRRLERGGGDDGRPVRASRSTPARSPSTTRRTTKRAFAQQVAERYRTRHFVDRVADR